VEEGEGQEFAPARQAPEIKGRIKFDPPSISNVIRRRKYQAIKRDGCMVSSSLCKENTELLSY
jgi:hypothetical protein